MARTKEKKIENTSVNFSKVIDDILKGKDYRNYHFNTDDPVDYKISTGSLLFDMATNGGFGPGIIRFLGQYAGGKTSECLEIAKNFQKDVSNSFILYVNAEGRINNEMLERAGVDYQDETKFKILQTQTLHVVFDTLKKCMIDNDAYPKDKQRKFLFIIDSMDALSPADDQVKSARDSARVAGGAVVTSHFLKTMGLMINLKGHMCICISQRRSTINADQYKRPDFKNHTASGGHALDHFANWIFEFEGRYKKDKILQNPTAAFDDDKNPSVGHMCKLRIIKSPVEKYDVPIQYPVKYGTNGSGSIWVAKEITDAMIKSGWVTQSGAWIKVSEEVIEACEELGIELPDKFQGQHSLFEFIEANKAFREYAYMRFVEVFSGI
jgi:RecA/RadA recombinase